MARDFTRYHAYLVAAELIDPAEYPDGLPLMYYGGEKRHARSLTPEPPRIDTGDNPAELQSGYGKRFAQESFTGGQYQRYFHRTGRDPARFLRSEGLDFSADRVRHLKQTSSMGGSIADLGKIVQARGFLYIAAGDSAIYRTADMVSTVTENPHAADPAGQPLLDITSDGTNVYAALANNGVHASLNGAAWAHWKPDGVNDLNISGPTNSAFLVRYVKARVMVAGNSGRGMYEVVNSSTPTRIGNLLPLGWEFIDIGENGEFIYAIAGNESAGMCRILHYGLDAAGTAIEQKGTSPMIYGTLFRSFLGYQDQVFLGGGVKNEAGGFDPVLYQGIPNESGHLRLVKLLEDEGASFGTDLSVYALYPDGDSLLLGWSMGTANPYGRREGIARYDLAREALFHSYADLPSSGSVDRVKGITRFLGRLAWTTDVLKYVDSVQGYGTEGFVISSVADFVSAALKTWDLVEISHKPLPPDSQLDVYYTTKMPEENSWTLLGTSNTVGSEGKSFRLTGVSSRFFALKIVSRTGVTAGTVDVSPEFLGWSVRAVPKSSPAQWIIERTILLARSMRHPTSNKEAFVNDPDARLIELQDLYEGWATLYERNVTYDVLIAEMETVDPAEPIIHSSNGTIDEEAHVVKLSMVATKV